MDTRISRQIPHRHLALIGVVLVVLQGLVAAGFGFSPVAMAATSAWVMQTVPADTPALMTGLSCETAPSGPMCVRRWATVLV